MILFGIILSSKENNMTNKEYIEKNNISFSEAMKMWDNKTSCINDWLNQEHKEHKFKVGDFVRKAVDDGRSNPNTYIGVVFDVKDKVYIKIITRNGTFHKWTIYTPSGLYYRDDNTVFVMFDEDIFEKIF